MSNQRGGKGKGKGKNKANKGQQEAEIKRPVVEADEM
jgi:hypothetical protein